MSCLTNIVKLVLSLSNITAPHLCSQFYCNMCVTVHNVCTHDARVLFSRRPTAHHDLMIPTQT